MKGNVWKVLSRGVVSYFLAISSEKIRDISLKTIYTFVIHSFVTEETERIILRLKGIATSLQRENPVSIPTPQDTREIRVRWKPFGLNSDSVCDKQRWTIGEGKCGDICCEVKQPPAPIRRQFSVSRFAFAALYKIIDPYSPFTQLEWRTSSTVQRCLFTIDFWSYKHARTTTLVFAPSPPPTLNDSVSSPKHESQCVRAVRGWY